MGPKQERMNRQKKIGKKNGIMSSSYGYGQQIGRNCGVVLYFTSELDHMPNGRRRLCHQLSRQSSQSNKSWMILVWLFTTSFDASVITCAAHIEMYRNDMTGTRRGKGLLPLFGVEPTGKLDTRLLILPNGSYSSLAMQNKRVYSFIDVQPLPHEFLVGLRFNSRLITKISLRISGRHLPKLCMINQANLFEIPNLSLFPLLTKTVSCLTFVFLSRQGYRQP